MRYFEIYTDNILNEVALKSIYNILLHAIKKSNKKGKNVFKGLKQALRVQTAETREMLDIFAKALKDKNSVSKADMKKANKQLIDLLKISGLTLPYFIPLPLVGTAFLISVIKLSNKYGVGHLLPKSIQHLDKV